MTAFTYISIILNFITLFTFIGYCIYYIRTLKKQLVKEKDLLCSKSDVKINVKVIENSVYIYINDIKCATVNLKELK